MQFYFIRHAQSTNNALWDKTHANLGRSDDPELTEIGWEQSRRLAKFLKTGNPRGGHSTPTHQPGFGLTHLYCSLMTRAAATAWVVSQALDLPPVALEDVYEEGGIYSEDQETGQRIGLPGKTRAYFEKTFPGIVLPETLPEAGWWNERPFEVGEARTERARRFVAALLKEHGHSDDRVAVISHGGFYNHVLAAITGLDARKGIWAVMYNTGITRIDFEPNFVDLVYFNRTDFLPADLVT